MENFNKYFDHTMLKADATEDDIVSLLDDAIRYDFASVCVNGCYVSFARKYLDRAGSRIPVAAVTGFPLGAMSTASKLSETQLALDDGAGEIDMVMNVGMAKSGDWDYILDEITQASELCHDRNGILKIILETCYLSPDEIRKACHIATSAGADFVKTSTGFGNYGAREEDLRLMKEAVSGKAQIKASGGIKSLEQALKFIVAGADRLGCSASVSIMEEYNKTNLLEE